LNKRVLIDQDKQLINHITYTNEEAAQIIKDNIHLNKHFNENIQSPRFNYIKLIQNLNFAIVIFNAICS
jgi:tRNA U34 5-carboxymethylaminomethyl modifying enzyme MnmG/GidA